MTDNPHGFTDDTETLFVGKHEIRPEDGVCVWCRHQVAHRGADGQWWQVPSTDLGCDLKRRILELEQVVAKLQSNLSTELEQALGALEAATRGFRLTNEVNEVLRAAIRTHRDARGDDRCWMDDEALYAVLPEGYTPPPRDTAVELDRCRQFIEARRNPATSYVSPERELERLRNILKAWLDWDDMEAPVDDPTKNAASWDAYLARKQSARDGVRAHTVAVLQQRA
jgi:hypothetical protein